jgi:hypothetical protein
MGYTIAEVERKTKIYADAHNELGKEVGLLQEKMEGIKTEAMRTIRRSVAATRERREELRSMVEASPELFEKPRTAVFYGVKVGFQKGKGKIVIDDPEKTIRKIREHLTALTDTLIETKETPRKSAIEQLDVADLKMIGCKVEGTDDMVVVKPVDGEIDKIIAALMRDEE